MLIIYSALTELIVVNICQNNLKSNLLTYIQKLLVEYHSKILTQQPFNFTVTAKIHTTNQLLLVMQSTVNRLSKRQ